MSVIDAHGRSIGSIVRVQMGEPQAVSFAGSESPTLGEPELLLAPAIPTQTDAGTVGVLPWDTDAEGLDDISEELRQNMQRTGFIEVDGPRLKGTNRFIPGDRIAQVSDTVVRLHTG